MRDIEPTNHFMGLRVDSKNTFRIAAHLHPESNEYNVKDLTLLRERRFVIEYFKWNFFFFLLSFQIRNH